MKIFALIFVAAVAFQGTSAAPAPAPILGPIWNIAPGQTVNGPATQTGLKNTAIFSTVKGDATQTALLNEALGNTVTGNAVQSGPANAAIGNVVKGDATQKNGLLNVSGLNTVDGKKTQSGLFNLDVLGTSKTYDSKGITLRLFSSGVPEKTEGVVIDLFNKDDPLGILKLG